MSGTPGPRFDEYVMVDWSARRRPATGADSVWIAHGWRAGGKLVISAVNPPTRASATERLAALLEAAVAGSRRVLVGFDFCLGYPSGFGEYTADLGPAGLPAWRRAWRVLAQRVVDGEDNENNRYEVADALNAATGTALFWGRPSGPRYARYSSLPPTRSVPSHLVARRCADLRWSERTAGRGIKSPWQLHGAGSVGGQTLVGVPRVDQLLETFRDTAAVWPFETGFTADARSPGAAPPAVVFAEIWPGTFPVVSPAAVRDEAQVRSVVAGCAAQDTTGFGAWLAPAAVRALDREARTAVEREEGWILGVGA